MNITDYIVEYPNALSESFCKEVIDKFESADDQYKSQGLVGTDRLYDPNIKKSLDYMLSLHADATDAKFLDDIFYENLLEYLPKYKNRFNSNSPESLHSGFYTCDQDVGYQVQKTGPGDFYDWHHDHCIGEDNNKLFQRHITFIWYLNNVNPETQKGRTQFKFGNGEIYSVIPETGKLLFFPAYPLFVHRGEPLEKGTKYICTGWMYTYQ